MKKLTKKSLEELAQVMPVLSEVEMRECVGGDIIRMGLDGTIKIVPNDEKVDYIMVSSDLNATKWGKRIDMPPGTSIMPNPPGGSGNLVFQNNGSGTFEQQQKMFEELANATAVEWGFASHDSTSNAGGIIFTSHSMSEVDITPANRNGYNTLYHSHPTISDDSGTASSGDIDVAHNLKEKYDYKYFGVYYTNSHGENEYEHYKP